MWKRWIVAGLALFPVGEAISQSPLQWYERMIGEGFQNIRLHTLPDGSTRLDAENRRYRFTGRALNRLLDGWDTGGAPLHIVLRERDIPMAHVTVVDSAITRIDWAARWLDGEAGRVLVKNASYMQFDVPLGVQYRYQLGDFTEVAQLAVDFVPGVDVTLAKGLSLQGGIAVPLYNDLDDKTRVRLDRLIAVQDLRMPDGLLVSAAAGFFSNNRAGVHTQWRKFLAGEQIALGMDAGYTVVSRLTGPERFESRENRPAPFYTFRLDVMWRKYNMVFELHAGQFLYGDAGAVGRVFRQFGEHRIGGEILWTTLGRNIGFFARWPLFPRKYAQPSKLRITGQPWIDIPYRYIGGDRAGRSFRYGQTLVDGIWEYYPGTLNR